MKNRFDRIANSIRFAIDDFLSCNELELSEEDIARAADALIERFEEEEEYNYRCGVHSVDLGALVERYFDLFREDYFENE